MKHLVQSERDEIEILCTKGYSIRSIAKVLGRSFETIRKKIKRNSVKGEYIAHKAQHKSYVRRHTCKKSLKKIRVHDELEKFIREKIKDDWTPEEVAYI